MPNLRDAIICEIWFWDADVDHLLGCIEDNPERWMVEKGVLREERDNVDGVKNLLKGDIVYRIRTKLGIARGEDPREKLFRWSMFNPFTGVEEQITL